jgi:rhamnose transport system substrate-binding protein
VEAVVVNSSKLENLKGRQLMRRRKLSLVGLVAGLAGITALAVGLSTGSAKSHAGYKIFFLPKTTTIPVFTQNAIGAKAAAKELGDKLTYNGPTDVSGPKQVPFIDSAARQGYNAIVISTPDPNAVAPALKRAAAKGVKVVSYDGDTAPSSRTIFVAPSTNSLIGALEVQWAGQETGYKGEIAILSATPTSPNQNTWIKFMKQELKKAKYKNMKLVKIAYGNDDPTESAKQTQALLQAYPNLKAIIAPTTVGIQAAAQELQQKGKCGKVQLTGLGLPNDMRKYVKAGCANKFGLWDEQALGYLSTYVAHYVIQGKLTGALGQTFKAGKLGTYKVVVSDGNKPVVVLGPPLAFTPQNIDKYRF